MGCNSESPNFLIATPNRRRMLLALYWFKNKGYIAELKCELKTLKKRQPAFQFCTLTFLYFQFFNVHKFSILNRAEISMTEEIKLSQNKLKCTMKPNLKPM